MSRQFIYSHPDLRATVEAAERTHQPATRRREISRAVGQGLGADRSTLAAKVQRQRITIAKLRERVADLEGQRQRWLGDQLVRYAVDPEEHAELRLTLNRLVSDKASVSRTVDELRRINGILEAELAASREAHAADVARYVAGAGGSTRGAKSAEHPGGADPRVVVGQLGQPVVVQWALLLDHHVAALRRELPGGVRCRLERVVGGLDPRFTPQSAASARPCAG